ncbi:hypothetical protein NOS3756_34630 [Nostoc sp. NIES-3756]|nr:hypothetical protein NOS3756_34630 [Nostoc sp. NIES-3756]BAY37740.1 hypothetical protein NIES2111_20810 [Nostoc sp. NIES-2111]
MATNLQSGVISAEILIGEVAGISLTNDCNSTMT